MNPLARPRTAYLLGGIAATLFGAAVVGLVVSRGTGLDPIGSAAVPNLVLGSCGFFAWGLLIAVRRPELPIGWLFLAGSIAELSASALAPWAYYSSAHWPTAVTHLLSTGFSVVWPIAYTLPFPLALMLFPDGALPGRRWRHVWIVPLLVYLTWVVRELLMPVPQALTVRQPSLFAVDLPSEAALSLNVMAGALAGVLCLLILGSFVTRYQRGGDAVRQQLLWLMTGFVVALAANGELIFTAHGSKLPLVAFELIPLGIAIAILRHQLLDIRLVVSKSLVFVVLTLLTIAAFTGLVALADAVVPRVTSVAPVAAALVVALAFNPVRLAVQARIDRWLYGARNDPFEAMSAVSSGMSAGGLVGVLESLGESLRLPYVGVHTRRTAVVSGAAEAASGAALESIPLPGVEDGELIVALRPGERALSRADRRVLALLAPALAAAVRAAELSSDVRQAHEAVVSGREEERRRIRRDLHDGLAPALTGFAMAVDAATNQLDSAPEETRQILDQLRLEMTRVIEDIRKLIYGLRPPALDDLGLVGAVRAQASRLDRRADGAALTVHIEGPEPLPELPAAVEVAAYRIATEALTNVARHSRASGATVSITANGVLELIVSDDGGRSRPWASGVGLESMAARAAEVGGSFDAGPTDLGGVVHVCLPLSLTPAGG